MNQNNTRLRYALIGCGRIAVNHINAAKQNNLELVALCDTNLSKIELLLLKTDQKHLNPKRYANYLDMIQQERLNLVAIATDSGNHAEIALACIEYGIHVIIEKPIAMSIHDSDKIIALSQEKKIKVSVCHQNRFNIAVQRLRQAVECNCFGTISHGSVHIRWNRNQEYYSQADWRGKWASDGGALMNQCIHGIDLLRWMIEDEVEEVYGVTKRQFHDYIESEDLGTAILKFKNGALGIIEGTTNIYPENLEETLCIFGETGTVKLGGKSVSKIDVWNFSGSSDDNIAGTAENVTNIYGNGHKSLYADMIKAILLDGSPLVDAIAGKNALEIVLAIYKSQKEGMPVKLPLSNFSTLDMTGTFAPKQYNP